MTKLRPFIYAPPTKPIEILHQDSDLLIVNKPAGLLSVPGKDDDKKDCLLTRLERLYEGVLLVHRLDVATSGVMVFAMNKDAQRHLGLQFEKRYIKKKYVADIVGPVKGDSGFINLPMRCDWPNRPRQMVCFEQGKNALTHWIKDFESKSFTRLSLFPTTGRSHQLRVHMLYGLGHAIIGDKIYADDAVYNLSDRLHLHAHKLSLRHPNGGEELEFSVPPPF